MLLHLSDADVEILVSLDDAIQVIEDLFLQESRGEVQNRPTTELYLPKGFFRLKAGAALASKTYGFKAYGTGRYIVFVYSMETNRMTGIVEAHRLTEIRTGAVSALGAKYMALPECETLAIIGTGREARTQVPAICRVRSVRQVRAFSRNAEHRERYAQEMRQKLGIDVIATASAEDCVRGANIVVTMTNAHDPVLSGAWLAEGAFICGVGATTPERRELDEEAVSRCGTIAVEHMAQAQAECGELRDAVAHGKLRWDDVHELEEIVSGAVPGRKSASEITLFDTIGIGSEDVALAAYALAKAEAEHVGETLPL